MTRHILCVPEEWNTASRTECNQHPHPPTCAFNDMADFFLPSVKAMLPQIQENGWIESKLMPLVMAKKAVTTILFKLHNTYHFLFV